MKAKQTRLVLQLIGVRGTIGTVNLNQLKMSPGAKSICKSPFLHPRILWYEGAEGSSDNAVKSIMESISKFIQTNQTGCRGKFVSASCFDLFIFTCNRNRHTNNSSCFSRFSWTCRALDRLRAGVHHLKYSLQAFLWPRLR